MKIKSLLHLVMVLVATQFIFSCSSAKYYEFAANKQAPYHQLKQKAASEAAPSVMEVAIAAAEQKASEKQAEPVLEASTAPVARKATPKAVSIKAPAEASKVAPTVTEAEALVMAKDRLASMTKAEKKELKKEFREALRQERGGSRTNIVEVILAILLPPLAVFLHDGLGTSFWINIILTLLFFIPGVIHALLVVTDTI
ncbi:YqaE/Pmp3 family membrane protein [Pontibacter ruber]|nr:YqaE/Pmp3 family membrane protein [Pontibacter ruber]